MARGSCTACRVREYNCTGDKNNIGRYLFKLAEKKRVFVGDIGEYSVKLRKLLEQISTYCGGSGSSRTASVV